MIEDKSTLSTRLCAQTPWQSGEGTRHSTLDTSRQVYEDKSMAFLAWDRLLHVVRGPSTEGGILGGALFSLSIFLFLATCSVVLYIHLTPSIIIELRFLSRSDDGETDKEGTKTGDKDMNGQAEASPDFE